MTSLLFPVATLWGTFEHAAGPLLVGLLVAAVLGADAFVAAHPRVAGVAADQRVAGAPDALVALTLPLTARPSRARRVRRETERRAIAEVGRSAARRAGGAGVGNSRPAHQRPPGLARGRHRPTAIALPDEPVSQS